MTNRKDTFVARQVREARAEAELTQVELAAKCGVTLRGVQAWEQATRTPRMDALAALSLALGKPIDYFFEPVPERADAA